MPLLYYWRGDNYERDLRFGAGFHLNQSSKRLHAVELGDSIWAFTRRRDGEYVMAAQLIVKAKTRNSPKFRYGGYRVWGDLVASRYFLGGVQAPLGPVIRQLSVQVAPGVIGQSFQGHAAVRAITAADHEVLLSLFNGAALDPRARLLPEDRFEAAALFGDAALVGVPHVSDPPRFTDARAAYLYGGAPVTRAARYVRELRERYQDRCQVCQWSALGAYGAETAEAHHAHWLSRGGGDDLDNLVLLCPNHHRVVHRCDAPLDYRDLSFVFGDRREPLSLNSHLAPAA